jgi:hypothetical protein
MQWCISNAFLMLQLNRPANLGHNAVRPTNEERWVT